MKTFLKTLLVATTPVVAATPPAATEPATAPAATSQPTAETPATQPGPKVAYVNPPLIIPDDTPIQNSNPNPRTEMVTFGLRL